MKGESGRKAGWAWEVVNGGVGRAYLWYRFQAVAEGSHPDSVSGGPGEHWRKARAKHETDRKQIGPKPAAINHHCGARPSHSLHMHTMHTHTHTYEQQEMKCGNSSEIRAARPMGIEGRKITLLLLLLRLSFYALFLSLSHPVCCSNAFQSLHRAKDTDAHTHKE